MQQGAVGGGPPVHVPKHRASLSSNVNALHLTARMGPAFARTEAAVYGVEEAAEVGMGAEIDELTPRQSKLLRVPPGQRTPAQVEALVSLTQELAGDFFDHLSLVRLRDTPPHASSRCPFERPLPRTGRARAAQEQHTELARTWSFSSLSEGAPLCTASEECNFFIIVLLGSVVVEERKVSHTEHETGTKGTGFNETRSIRSLIAGSLR